MDSRGNSVIEGLRKPLSRAAAGILVLVTFLTTPRSFESVSLLGECLKLLGFTLLIIAALGRIWCAIYISGRKDNVLCRDGPYSLSRNPLYFFSFIGVAGFTVGLQNLVMLVVTSAVFLIYYAFVIRSEERRLLALFGSDYVEYRAATPRFFPALRMPTRLDSCTISPRNIERSLTEVVWFLLAILLIEILEQIHHAGYMLMGSMPF